MNRIFRIAMALALTLSSTPAWAALEQEVDVKVQQRYQKTWNGAPSAHPLEYGDIPNGLILERYRLDFQNEKYTMDVEATNVGQNNQAIRLEGGQPGKMTWKVGWDEMPHLFSNEARSPFVYQGAGVMALPGAFRSVELTTNDYAAGNQSSTIQGRLNAKFNTGISTALANAPYVGLGFDVNTGNIDLKFHPAHDFTVDIGAWRQTKRGTKAQTAAFGFSNSIELAAPIDWETNEAYLDLGLTKKDYQLGFVYRLSDFNNKIPNLYWDNPKRLTDQYAQNGYSQGDQSKNGAMAMAPDNKAHALKIEGGVNLPMNSRFSGEAGYQLWTARNAMLPYTTNTAIKPGALAVAQGAAYVPSFDASDPASRPSEDIVGKIEVYTYMGKFTSRPLHWLRGSVSHEAYIMENKSQSYNVPGWAVFDQGWHAEVTSTPREQFRDDKTTLGLDYDITSWLSGGTDIKHIYKKQTREVPKLHEYEVEQGFTIRPSKDLFVNMSYQLALRRGNSVEFQHYPKDTSTATGRVYFTEHPGMRRIDVADRNRNQGRLQVQWTPGEASYGLSARLTDDKYRISGSAIGEDVLVTPDLFGTTSDRTAAVGTDMSIPLFDGVVLDAYYEFDHARRYLRSSQTGCAGTTGTTNGYGLPGEPVCNSGTTAPTIMTGDPRSVWILRTTDRSHIAGLAVNWQATSKLKTLFGYDIVSTLQNYDPMYAGAYASTATDPYVAFPTSKRLTQTFRTKGEYKILKDLTFVANYMFEKFDASDWAYNVDSTVLRHYNDAIWMGVNPVRNYYAHTVGAGLNYKF